MSSLKMSIASWGEVALDKRELKTLMRQAGNEIAGRTRRLVAPSSGSGRYYYGGGGSAYRGSYVAEPYYASAPLQPPVRVSGTLRGSLRVYPYPDGNGFAVRERAFYAVFLEAGARGGGNPGRRARRGQSRHRRARGAYHARVLLPRPHLDVVMADAAPELDKRVRAAFEGGLGWKQTK